MKNSKTEFDSKEDYDAKEFEKDLRATEYEDKTYEKLANTGVKQDVAYSASKLMGIFARNLGVNKQAFDNWYNKLFVTNKPANEVNKNGTHFQSAAMYKSPKEKFKEFYNQVFEKEKEAKKNNTKLQKSYFDYTDDNVSVRIPHDTVIHDNNKHSLSADEWNIILKKLNNPIEAVIGNKPRFDGTPVLLKYKNMNKTYGVVVECFENRQPIISTAFKDTEKNIDNWLKNENPSQARNTSSVTTKGLLLSKGSSNIIQYVKAKLNPNVKNGNTYFQSAETAGWEFNNREKFSVFVITSRPTDGVAIQSRGSGSCHSAEQNNPVNCFVRGATHSHA